MKRQAISTLLHAAIVFVLLAWAMLSPAPAQYSASPGDSGPKAAQPVPENRRDWRDILQPQRCPNGGPAALNTCGDGRDGFVWGWDSFSQHMELRPPKVLYGPGYITSNTGMTVNTWTNLYGSIGANGFRTGLTAYIPRGNYMGFGQVAFASGSTANSAYTIRVLMGTCLQATGSQQGILTIPNKATNAATAAGAVDGTNNVLGFASTTCILPGMVAYNVTHSLSIPAHTVVCSVTSTTIKLVVDTAYPSCTASGFVAAPGVSSGDTIEFGFTIGYGGPFTWPGGASTAFSVGYFYNTAGLQCLAADRSDQQCEIFVEAYTTDTAATVLNGGGQTTFPPYSTSFNIFRVDGGYGAQ